MLGAFIESVRPVIGAGCITDYANQEMALDSLVTVCERHPNALLILAPLHPEVSERMQFCAPSSNIADCWLSFDRHWPIEYSGPT